MILKILISIITGIITGLLGAYGGAENTSKAIRRIGIPVILTLFAYICLHSLWVLVLLLLFVSLSAGYGVICHNDSGSTIGRFYYNLLKKYKPTMPEIDVQDFASILTRATIGAIIALTAIVLPILKGNWLIYTIGSALIINVWAWLSWRGLGSIKLFHKYLTYSEIVTFGVIGLGISLVILF